MQTEELIFDLTCEATKPEGPQALIVQSVIQHSQSIAGIVQLAASNDPKIVQRHQAHRDMCNEYITLHLSDLLAREGQKYKQTKYKFKNKDWLKHNDVNLTNKQKLSSRLYGCNVWGRSLQWYLQEGEVRVSTKVCNLQVSMDDLASGVKELQNLIVIFQAGGQG